MPDQTEGEPIVTFSTESLMCISNAAAAIKIRIKERAMYLTRRQGRTTVSHSDAKRAVNHFRLVVGPSQPDTSATTTKETEA